MLQLSEIHGPPLADTALTINDLFRQNVLDFPDTVALICTHQPSDLYDVASFSIGDDNAKPTYLRWTYQELDNAIQRFANRLRNRGLRAGDPLLIFMSNSAEYVIATWAAYRIGCVHVPINPKSLSHTREVQHMLQTAMNGCHAESIATIAGNATMCAQIEELTSGLDCMKILVEGQMDGWTSFEDLMQRSTGIDQDGPCNDCNSERSGSSILFTSGTTSLPKGCFIQTPSYPLTVATSWRQSSQPMLPGDRFLLALPNNHAFSYLCLMSSFINAATIVFPGPGFVPETVIQAIQQEQCSHTAFVPTMVLALSGVPLAPEQKLISLRRTLLAGAPPTEEVIRICLEHLGASGVENQYGMTEGVLVSSDVVGHVSGILNGRDVSIGSPLPSAKVRVCAEGSRTPLPVGIAGEVHFSGPTLIKEYIGRADDDKFYIDKDDQTWFCTGDKAIMGKDDRLYLVGRYKDTIIRGGENIEPSAIEAVLGQISEFYVLEPQIVRLPDNIAGEVPIAVVNQTIDEETARRLKNTIRAKMGTLYVPAEVVTVQSLGVEAYPKTMAGKIQKSKLEDLVKAYWGERKCQTRNKLYTRYILESRLKQTWAQLSGFDDASLIDVNIGLAAFASEAMLVPLQRKIWQDMASSVSFSDWVAADSISEQARLIELAQQDQPTEHVGLGDGQSIVEFPLGSRVMDLLLSAIAEEKGCRIDPNTQMVDLGVDSILSISILDRVRKETGVSLPSSLFFTQKTVSEISDCLCSISNPTDLPDFSTSTQEGPKGLCFSTLLQGTPNPGVPSLFLTPPGSGYAFSYDPLPKFANDFAIYSLGSPFLMTKSEATWTVEEAAALYVKTIRSLQAQGPYLLGGWSMGAITAYEIAYQLHQQGERVLGIINLDMPIPRPDPKMVEPTVKLLEILGFYPSIRREGQPDMEIPAYRRQHSLSSVLAKTKYFPRPISTPGNSTPVRIFVIWAGHGDPDRLPSALLEANEILKKHGPQTQHRTSQDWLQIPRESFGPGAGQNWSETRTSSVMS
ncbi:acetyl-CoA synthetase-like protein [Penicillium samsonianum]|uniref:acetyl-CoA synthetase-like protein n=1 Tax=Penicillium samsonianum TaxID=1882272 RepID=UPI002546F7C8|nr:acetyl-CoA synthetase-like protein [Penicillium samsonianum]KAJ6143009.1 acetyl-CoA synthetase-like protein [Penicillium samsonianum]